MEWTSAWGSPSVELMAINPPALSGPMQGGPGAGWINGPTSAELARAPERHVEAEALVRVDHQQVELRGAVVDRRTRVVADLNPHVPCLTPVELGRVGQAQLGRRHIGREHQVILVVER